MFKVLLEILKNRSKVGLINFLLELTVGVLSEWQRSNQNGHLDKLKQVSPMEKFNETQKSKINPENFN